MKINQFKKLQRSIEKQDFFTSYRNIDKTLFYLSIFGNIASIFCAFFFLSKLIFDSLTFITNPWIVWVSCLIILVGVELLKREIFDKFSLEFVRYKNITRKEVLNLFISSVMIISISFYASLNGAKEFSSKSDYIENQVTENTKVYSDSLSKYYHQKISDIENENKLLKSKIEIKDSERTRIESSEKLNSQNRRRISDLKNDEIMLRDQRINNDSTINKLIAEMDTKVNEYNQKLIVESSKEKSKNETNSFVFVMISLFIELVILVGIYFDKLYKYRSYEDFNTKMSRDPIYQKWKVYQSIIDVIYMNNPSPNDRVQSMSAIISFCRINGNNYSQKTISDAMRLFGALSITRTNGNMRIVLMDRENAEESLKKYFNLD
jgi:hypothetical protein